MIDNKWEQNLIWNVVLINITVCIMCHKVWQLIGNACHCQIMSNNEMPLDCGGESIKIHLSLSVIWSRETKLHFSAHAVVILFRHGRVTLEWINQSCVWWAESLSLLSLPAAGINGEWASLRQKQHKTGFPCNHIQQQGVSCASTLYISDTHVKWQLWNSWTRNN